MGLGGAFLCVCWPGGRTKKILLNLHINLHTARGPAGPPCAGVPRPHVNLRIFKIAKCDIVLCQNAIKKYYKMQ